MTQPTNELTTTTTGDETEELTWANLEIQKAQRQITRGVSELAEGIVSLSLVLLDVRRRRLYRFDPEFPTFEAFVEQRHGISVKTAHHYAEALFSLGETQYRALVHDVGVQRTYALSMLQRTDPALLTAFHALPDTERRAVTVAQIQAVDEAAMAELRTRVAELEQDITRERGLHQQSRKRLQEAEALHQRVASDLIEERDTARQQLDGEQEQTERLRALLSEARRQASGNTGSTAARSALPSPQGVVSVGEATVIGLSNLHEIVIEANALVEKLSQLPAADSDVMSPEQSEVLHDVLHRLQHTVEVVLHGS